MWMMESWLYTFKILAQNWIANRSSKGHRTGTDLCFMYVWHHVGDVSAAEAGAVYIQVCLFPNQSWSRTASWSVLVVFVFNWGRLFILRQTSSPRPSSVYRRFAVSTRSSRDQQHQNKFPFARRRGDVFAVRCNSIFRFKYEYPGAARPPGKMRLENRRRPLPPVCFYFEICIFNCGKESTARNPLYSGKSGEKGTNLIFL